MFDEEPKNSGGGGGGSNCCFDRLTPETSKELANLVTDGLSPMCKTMATFLCPRCTTEAAMTALLMIAVTHGGLKYKSAITAFQRAFNDIYKEKIVGVVLEDNDD